jgi:hypothetical protein
MKSTRVAEGSRSIRSSPPFRRLGAVAAVAPTWRCGTPSSLLRIRAREAIFACHAIRNVFRRWRTMLTIGLVLTLCFGDVLLVSCLLGQDDLANLVQRIELDSSFADHVVHFDHARKGGY